MKILQRVGAILLLIAATFGVYWPALKNGFVWDDTALVLRDPLIRSWRLIPESFHHFLFMDATASNFYRPLQRLSFMGDYALWEFFPRGYHFTSILAHLVAAVMLFLLAEIWLGQRRRWAAFAVALVWAVHPIHTSAVTYVSGRADSLAAIFGFLGLALGLISLAGGKRANWAAVGAALCFFAAFLSKESGLAALLIWFLVLIWSRLPWKVIGKWGLVAVTILGTYGVLRSTAERTLPPSGTGPKPIERPALVARAVAEYAGLIIAPTNLRMERDVRSMTSGDPAAIARSKTLRGYQTWVGVVLIGLLAAWFWWARRRAPEAALALLAAVVAYVPISNVFALNATAAEHWLYVPSAFLFLAVAASLPAIHWFQRPILWRVGTAALAAWTVLLGIRTWTRHGDWLDQPTFLLETIKAGGDTARMHVNLGHHKASKGLNEEALEEFHEALRIKPGQTHALFGVASISTRLGRYTEAREALEKVKDDSS
ncbi:MAG: tetratricopeptide repeat protein, partial [Chthoniobacteraceae bacterium]